MESGFKSTCLGLTVVAIWSPVVAAGMGELQLSALPGVYSWAGDATCAMLYSPK